MWLAELKIYVTAYCKEIYDPVIVGTMKPGKPSPDFLG